MRKRYSAAFKAQVVLELLKEEKAVNQLAAEHGVHPTQLRDWKKQALDGLPNLFEQSPEAARLAAAQERERDELFAQIGRLTTQLAWLTHRPTPARGGGHGQKNLASNLPRRERVASVNWDTAELPLTIQAELLGLNRSGLYYQPVPPSPEELWIKRRIDEIYTQWPFYGSRKFTAELRKELVINRKAVQRHMRDMGLAAICPGPNLSQRRQDHAIYPYLLRNLSIVRPNQVWGIETSYRQMNQVRARTTSRNPTLRLLLVGLAFILVNLYVALRGQLSSASRHALATASLWLSLRRLALLLGRAVEQLYGVTTILQRRRILLLL